METVLHEPFKTVPLSQFRPELKFEFPELPEQLFDYALIKAARTLAKEGNILRRRIVIHPYPNAENYKLVSPDGYEICSVIGIRRVNNCCTNPVTRTFNPPEISLLCPRHMAWYDDIDEELHITGTYRCHSTYFVLVTVCPPDDACELPAVYYDEYSDLLLLGAKARILRMHNKPWTNLQLAVIYEKGFNDGIASVAVEAALKKQRGTFKVNWGRIL